VPRVLRRYLNQFCSRSLLLRYFTISSRTTDVAKMNNPAASWTNKYHKTAALTNKFSFQKHAFHSPLRFEIRRKTPFCRRIQLTSLDSSKHPFSSRFHRPFLRTKAYEHINNIASESLSAEIYKIKPPRFYNLQETADEFPPLAPNLVGTQVSSKKERVP
jgi:hypothetical protein